MTDTTLKDEPSKLYVAGLSQETDEMALELEMSKYGNVSEVLLIKDKMTGRSRGFGFVTYENASDANLAVQGLNGKEFMGKVVKVDHANKPSFEQPGYTPNQGRGGGGGGRGGRGGRGSDRGFRGGGGSRGGMRGRGMGDRGGRGGFQGRGGYSDRGARGGGYQRGGGLRGRGAPRMDGGPPMKRQRTDPGDHPNDGYRGDWGRSRDERRGPSAPVPLMAADTGRGYGGGDRGYGESRYGDYGARDQPPSRDYGSVRDLPPPRDYPPRDYPPSREPAPTRDYPPRESHDYPPRDSYSAARDYPPERDSYAAPRDYGNRDYPSTGRSDYQSHDYAAPTSRDYGGSASRDYPTTASREYPSAGARRSYDDAYPPPREYSSASRDYPAQSNGRESGYSREYDSYSAPSGRDYENRYAGSGSRDYGEYGGATRTAAPTHPSASSYSSDAGRARYDAYASRDPYTEERGPVDKGAYGARDPYAADVSRARPPERSAGPLLSRGYDPHY